VLRLTTAGVGLNEIARRVGVAPSTVRLTLKRVVIAGLSWPLPAEMTDTALEAALFATVGTKQGYRRHVEPDWAEIHCELKRKHVTLTMLWDRVHRALPRGVSLFALLRAVLQLHIAIVGDDAASSSRRRQAVCRLRRRHGAGDRRPVYRPGSVRCRFSSPSWAASNFTYAEASWTQALADWIGAHTRAFAALGGVPKLLVPDNTKVAVIKACLYEPQVNRTPAFAGAGSTPRWRPITISRSCRHGHATRRRSKSRC
jgi:hypothetical protein